MQLQVATSGEAVGGSRYRTLGRLGTGGMAEVDLALQLGVAGASRLCVLKRVRQDLAGRQEFVSMFFDEARISASLNHPNIVQIYEVGGDEQDCFLAMEFLRGCSYAHLQHGSPGGVLDYRVDLEVLLATLTGLEHAHQRRDLSGELMRLVHRDVSPPNVFVTYDGEIKVLDFGVAKSKDSLVKTEAGILKGKAAYMAPEVVAGDGIDARADLYAVGVMLWEATALRDRWPRMNDVVILAQLARGGAVESPGATERGLPALADEICIKALAMAPGQRYQTAAEFRDALAELCEMLGGRLSQLELRDYMQRRFAAERAREEREVDAALNGPSEVAQETQLGGFTKQVRRVSQQPPSADQALVASHPGRGSLWLGAAALAVLGAVVAKLLIPSGPVSSTKTDVTVDERLTPSAKVASAVAASASAPALDSAAVAARVAPPAASNRAQTGAPLSRPKPPSAAPAVPPPAAKPAESKRLQLDRQDPWQ